MSRLTVVASSPHWDPSDTNLWTIKECAAFLGLTPAALYHRVEADEVPCVRFGRCIRFVPSRVRAWVVSQEVTP